LAGRLSVENFGGASTWSYARNTSFVHALLRDALTLREFLATATHLRYEVVKGE
jgi:hypothetical protein